jgi:hypothetical protein
MTTITTPQELRDWFNAQLDKSSSSQILNDDEKVDVREHYAIDLRRQLATITGLSPSSITAAVRKTPKRLADRNYAAINAALQDGRLNT